MVVSWNLARKLSQSGFASLLQFGIPGINAISACGIVLAAPFSLHSVVSLQIDEAWIKNFGHGVPRPRKQWYNPGEKATASFPENLGRRTCSWGAGGGLGSKPHTSPMEPIFCFECESSELAAGMSSALKSSWYHSISIKILAVCHLSGVCTPNSFHKKFWAQMPQR